MMNKYTKFLLLTFKWFSYVLGGLAILILISYGIGYAAKVVYPIYINYKIQQSPEKVNTSPEPQNITCINKQKSNLFSNLKTCWQQNDNEGIKLLISQAYFIPSQERGAVTVWLRNQIESESFSNGEEVRLIALNLIVATEEEKLTYPERVKDRAYLKSIINSNFTDKYLALIILGYYKDDEDIPIFVEMADSNIEWEMVFSIDSLIKNCSPKARLALKKVMSLPNVRTFLEENQRAEKLKSEIATQCPASSPAYD